MDPIKNLSISGGQQGFFVTQPKDVLLARLNFLLLGTASLIGFFSIINSLDFFEQQYPDFDTKFYLTIPNQIGIIITSLLMPKIVQRVTYKQRVISGFFALILTLVLLPLIAIELPNDAIGFALILFIMFFAGVFSQLLGSSSVGVAAQMSYIYLNDFNFGCTFSSIVMLIFRIIALLSFPSSNENRSTIMYFSVGAAWIVLTVIVFLFFLDNAQYRNSLNADTLTPMGSFYFGDGKNNKFDVDNEDDLVETKDDPLEHQISISNQQSSYFFWFQMVRQLYPLPVYMVLNCTITAMLFPAIILGAPVRGMSLDWGSVLLCGINYVFSMTGRFMAVFRKIYSKKLVYFLVWFRLIFFIFFIWNFVAYNDSKISDNESPFYQNWIIFILVAIYALTDSFSISAIFILGSQESTKQHEKEVGGFISNYALTIGYTLGFVFAIPFTKIN